MKNNINLQELLEEKISIHGERLSATDNFTKGMYVGTVAATNKDLLRAVLPLLKKLFDDFRINERYPDLPSSKAFMDYLKSLIT